MIKYLIASLGFAKATRAVAGLVSGTAFLAWMCAIPNPERPLNKDDGTKWLSVKKWVDTSAFQNSTFNWFVASIAFMFFGFYAIFFNLEEVSLSWFPILIKTEH
jgi:MCP family monocarboxylic acid transporter-like MFS transporter 10